MLDACRFPGGSAGSRRERGRVLAVAAILAFCAVAARPAVSENWVPLSRDGITAIAVDADSLTTTVVGSTETRSHGVGSLMP